MPTLSAPTILDEQDGTRPRRGMLRDTLNTIFYYRRLALIVLAAIAALALVIALVMPARYTAHAQLLALAADVYDAQAQGQNSATQKILDPAVIANVEMQILDSEELHRAVVKNILPAGASEAQVAEGVLKFEKRLHVTKVSDANVIDLSFTAGSPQEAEEALRTLLKVYMVQRATILTGDRVAFLTRQRDEAKAKLDAADAQIAEFQKRHGVVDIAGQTASAVQQNGALRQQLEQTNAALADAGSALGRMRSDADKQPQQVELYSDNTEAARTLGEMQQSLLALRAKRSDLASRFMAGSPRVTAVDSQIAGLEKALAVQRRELVTTRRVGRNDFYYSARDRLAQAEAAAAGTRARAGTLASQVAQSDSALATLIGISDTLARMRLQRDVLANSYRDLATQVEQSRVQLDLSGASGGTNVRVIQAPDAPLRRSNPPMLVIGAGIVIGLLLAGATVFVLSTLRETFINAGEAEHALGVPVLAAPLDSDAARPEAMRRALGRLVGTVDMAAGATGRFVLLLSPVSRTATRDVALALGHAVMRRPDHRVLLLRCAPSGEAETPDGRIEVHRYEGMDTAVVPIDLPLTDPDFVVQVRARYDSVVVTAPPTLDCYDSIDLARACDIVFAVVEAEKTRRPLIEDMASQLRQIGKPLAGLVMTGRRRHVPDRLYKLLFAAGAPDTPEPRPAPAEVAVA